MTLYTRLRRGALLLSAVPLMILGVFMGFGGDPVPVLKESTERVLIVDPGHGGEDGGAVGVGGVKESEINLAVSERLSLIAELCGVQTVMTRAGEEISYPPEADTTAKRKRYDQQRRVELIAFYPNAVLISVHQNFFPDSRPRGPQALYGTAEGSQELGERIHGDLTKALCPESRRVAIPAGRDIYLMRSVECPAVLVECGFLSNGEECALLTSENYQTKLALVIAAGYLNFEAG